MTAAFPFRRRSHVFALIASLVLSISLLAGLGKLVYSSVEKNAAGADSVIERPAARLNLDYWRVVTTIDRYGAGAQDVNLDDVLRQLDVLSSRLRMFERDEIGSQLSSVEGAGDTVAALAASLRTIEPELKVLVPGDRDTFANLRARLGAHAAPMYQLAQREYVKGQAVYDELRRDTVRSYWIFGGVFLGIVACGAVLIVLFVAEIRGADQLLAAATDAESRSRVIANHLTAVLDSAATSIITIDAAGTVTSFNPAAETLFGYRPEEVISNNVSMLMPEPYREGHDGYLAGYLAGGAPKVIGKSREASGRRRDGTVFPIELSVGEMWSDGKRYFVGFVTDLTERKRMEAELLHAQRMEALGRLTGGVAHEFNNQLLAIGGFARLLQRASAHGETEKTWLENIVTATEQASSLTDQLLSFGRKKDMAPKVIGIGRALQEAQILLQPMIDGAVVLRCDLNDEQARVRVDPGAFSQALLNLAINACDAMPDGGTLTLSSRVVRLDRAALAGFEDTKPGPYVAVGVSDTGTGIDEDILNHIFEPFFTTKDASKGTGLGLSMVYGMVRQCGGSIAVESRPDAGTTFTIYLPLAEEAAAVATADEDEDVVPAAPGGRETVLVAEDEAIVRELLKALLERLGYRVLVAHDGMAAQRIFHERNGRIDLLLTDMVMPGLSGRQLARSLIAAKPDLKVLYMTGYDPSGDGDGVSGQDETVIRKPFKLQDLGQTMRQVLDG